MDAVFFVKLHLKMRVVVKIGKDRGAPRHFREALAVHHDRVARLPTARVRVGEPQDRRVRHRHLGTVFMT